MCRHGPGQLLHLLQCGRVDLAWASYDPGAAERAAEAIVHGEQVPG